MVRRVVAWGALIGALCGLCAEAAELVAYPVCTAEGKQEQPDIDGDIVVWTDHRNGEADIYGYDLKAKREFPICTAPGRQHSPVVCGHVVGWLDAGVTTDVFGRPWVGDLESGETAQLAADLGGLSQSLVVSPNWAVWLHREHSGPDLEAERWRLHARKLDGTAEGDIAMSDVHTPMTGGVGFHFLGYGLGISPDDVVVWYDRREGRSELRAYDLRTNVDRLLLDVEDHVKSSNLAIDRSTALWISGLGPDLRWVYAHDLATDTGSWLGAPTFEASELMQLTERIDISEGTAVWEQLGPGSHQMIYDRLDVWACSVKGGTPFPVRTGPANQGHPSISGKRVVCTEDEDIWVVELP